MSETLQRSLTVSEGMYSNIGRGVLEGVGMSLVDLADQNPLAAYRIIVDHVISTAQAADKILGEGVRALTGQDPEEDETTENELKKMLLEDVAGHSVKMSIYVTRRQSPRDLIMGTKPKKEEMLSFEADLSEIKL